MSTFITELEPSGHGPNLALKDLIDVRGVPTTAGSRAVALGAVPAELDARCLRGARIAEARIVGKTNLYELAFGASGVNPHYGTPRNPLDPSLLPGGSSSGSAVAVAEGRADVAYGSDTGGSIRVPAAFCGIAGLKTTHGRIPLEGVYPLAPSLDTVGPMATTVSGLVLGMELLEPGFTPGAPARSAALVRDTGAPIDPEVEAAVERACRLAELALSECSLPQWMPAFRAAEIVLCSEAARSNRHLVRNPALRALLSAPVRERLAAGARMAASYPSAEAARAGWRRALEGALAHAELLALPTVGFFPPPLEEALAHTYTHLTMPLNFAGYPAVAIPVPTSTRLPASLQLVGPPGSEGVLLATARCVEAAVAA